MAFERGQRAALAQVLFRLVEREQLFERREPLLLASALAAPGIDLNFRLR